MNGRIIKLILVIVMMGISRVGWAACSMTGSTYNYTATIPAQTFVVMNNAIPTAPIAIGGVIAITPNGSARNVSCSGTSNAYFQFNPVLSTSDIPGYMDTFKTNIDGIGVKVWTEIGSSIYVDNTLVHWAGFTGSIRLIHMKMQYYIIGPVIAGTKTFDDIVVEGWASDNGTLADGKMFNKLTIKMAGPATIIVPGCKTPSISVPLGKHSRSDFSGVNSTSTREVPFIFAINDCSADTNTVHYTFRPAAGVSVGGSGATEHLTLDSSSSASGVGIQVLYNSGAGTTLVPLNTKTQFTDYTTGGGTFTIPMKARYIQTASTVTAGTANSAIEFAMSYE